MWHTFCVCVCLGWLCVFTILSFASSAMLSLCATASTLEMAHCTLTARQSFCT
ncbi:hypothetical protein PR003_g12576 [Phytophthora rubi]|uniref:Uncharacterized protein n=1 Tax=Phytophthora rubi TaxID=129364 RepID=A0A6A3GBE7_9STRA|nr:hypothetical protein PR001_g32651 [Phytophthora rubi]KAE8999514.1 hypothetical protein PR002_g18433 [Phytophthora rubi]KAE9336314.1 hypothetical protein PR003_g12576 [Phytophthora rubi]